MKRYIQVTGVLLTFVVLCAVLSGCESSDYRKAKKLCDKGEYLEASAIFSSLEDYKDSAELAKEAYRLYGVQLMENGDYEESILVLEELVEDYAPAQETLGEIKLSYGEDLSEKGDYEKAAEIFRDCEESEALKSTLDELANTLISQGDYKDAYRFLYLHDANEKWMQDFLYEYLNWQMDNRDYVDTAETFSAIQGYQDTLTNDKFAGARLMAMGFVQWDKSEVDIWSGGSVLLLSLSFTDEQQLHFSVSGGTVNFYTFDMTNEVSISDSWDFYFDGKSIYVKDEGKFIKAGTIEAFKSESDGTAKSVTLSLDLPGMMTIKSSAFDRA